MDHITENQLDQNEDASIEQADLESICAASGVRAGLYAVRTDIQSCL